jgi:DNA-binding response OmpR family regulator
VFLAEYKNIQPMSLKPLILVVDDEEHIRLTLQFALRQNYNILLASNSEEALSLLNTNPVDLVLLDIKMSHESGLDLLPKIKAKDPLVEVIMLTGYSTIHYIQDAWSNEAFAFLSKPPDIKGLNATLTKALASRRRNLALKEGLTQQSDKQKELTSLQNGVIHDMNNILTIAMGLTQLLNIKLEAASTLSKADILKANHSLNEIEKQLTLCAKISRSHLRVVNLTQGESTHSVDLFDMVTNLCGLLKCHDTVKHVSYEFPPFTLDIGKVQVSQLAIFQLLLNLALNAGQSLSTPHTVRIEIVPAQPNLQLDETPTLRVLGAEHYNSTQAYIGLRISDKGTGVSPDQIPHLFSQIRTTKAEGTGLGLPLIASLVSQNKLILNFHSIQNSGTTVTLFLPLHQL